MTKAQVKKLERGTEIFDRESGEVIRLTANIGTVGDTIFVEGMNREGKFRCWPHRNVEKV